MNESSDGKDRLEQSLIDISIESWRLSRLLSRILSKLDAGESARYISQIRYFQKKVFDLLASNQLEAVNLEGHPYDSGVAASALNAGDFGPDDSLIIDQMVEPIIMSENGLRRQGVIMLKKI